MFKKLAAVCAVFALFACTGDNDIDVDNNATTPSSSATGGENSSSSLDISSSSGEGPSSSSSGGEPGSSSSSEEPGSSSSGEEPGSSSSDATPPLKTVDVALFDGKASIFGTFAYGYTLKGGAKENLEDYWDVENTEDCPTTEQTKAPPEKCRLDNSNAILQNQLTNQYSPLHYKIDGFTVPSTTSISRAIKLEGYNLQAAGDQAALGFDVGEGEKDISAIAGTKEFFYRYEGGAHEFRAAESDEDFWFVKVEASPDYKEIDISFSDFEGMGTLEATPFDLSRVKKFLWIVEFDSKNATNNTGSLAIDYIKGRAEQ